MEPIELTLTVESNERLRARTRSGAEAPEGSVQFDKLTRDTITIFQKWLSRGQVSERRELEVLGTNLYQVIFDETIGAFFEEHLDRARKDNQRLRVQLSFQERAGDLADLPWEYLYRPDTEMRAGYFLCTYADLVLSRYMPLGTDHKILEPEESPLRILIVVSNPEEENLGPVIPGLGPAVPGNEVIQRIQALSEEDHPIEFDILNKPTVDNFLRSLEDFKPHVLHFIGYGRSDRIEGKGEIALLESDEQNVEWIRDREFADYFVRVRSIPPLVVLHLWETLSTDPNANFAMLAPELIRRNIPAVVAMQYPITNKAAIAFSRAFYRELAKGVPVDDAVQIGRWRITTKVPKAYDNRGFGTPVLYMHSSGSIVQPGQKKTESSSEPSPLPQFGTAGHAADKADKVAENKSSLSDIVIKACSQRMEELELNEEQKMRMDKKLYIIREELASKGTSEMEATIRNWYNLERDPKLEQIIESALFALKNATARNRT